MSISLWNMKIVTINPSNDRGCWGCNTTYNTHNSENLFKTIWWLFGIFDKILFSAQSILIKIHRFLFDLTCSLTLISFSLLSIHLFSLEQCMPRYLTDNQPTLYRIEIANEPASASQQHQHRNHVSNKASWEWMNFRISGKFYFITLYSFLFTSPIQLNSLISVRDAQSMSWYASRYDISKLIIKVSQDSLYLSEWVNELNECLSSTMNDISMKIKSTCNPWFSLDAIYNLHITEADENEKKTIKKLLKNHI